jgi:hypothetical protein
VQILRLGLLYGNRRRSCSAVIGNRPLIRVLRFVTMGRLGPVWRHAFGHGCLGTVVGHDEDKLRGSQSLARSGSREEDRWGIGVYPSTGPSSP